MKLKKSEKPSSNVKLTDIEVLEQARKICEDKKFFIGEYITEAVKKENKKHSKNGN
jgi:hypothetical protein